MKLRRFLNALRILRSIDRHEVGWMPEILWQRFNDDPFETLLRLDDDMAAKVFAVVKKRQTEPKRFFFVDLVPGVINYDTTPGGERQEDGSIRYGPIVPLIKLWEHIENRDEVAAKLVEILNEEWE